MSKSRRPRRVSAPLWADNLRTMMEKLMLDFSRLADQVARISGNVTSAVALLNTQRQITVDLQHQVQALAGQVTDDPLVSAKLASIAAALGDQNTVLEAAMTQNPSIPDPKPVDPTPAAVAAAADPEAPAAIGAALSPTGEV
jgi:hypothetical protein